MSAAGSLRHSRGHRDQAKLLAKRHDARIQVRMQEVTRRLMGDKPRAHDDWLDASWFVQEMSAAGQTGRVIYDPLIGESPKDLAIQRPRMFSSLQFGPTLKDFGVITNLGA